MWVIDGDFKGDAWYSEDGINWKEATSGEAFPVRNEHNSVVYDDKVWIIGGSSIARNDVWYTELP